jgi:tetratricopeptide (TPR) repeat protein
MEINDAVSDAVNAALEAAQRGRFQFAMDTLTDLLPEHPLHHDVPYGIGVLHALKGEIVESIRWFDKAIAIYPYRIDSHYNKAVSHQKLFDIPNCVRSYQKVVKIGPSDDPEVEKARSFIEAMAAAIKRNQGISLDAYLRSGDKFNQAFELMEHGDWRGALAGFRASAAINDRNAPCHGNMGICHGHLGHKAEALAAFDRALEIDPDYQPALSNRMLMENMEEGKPLANTDFQIVNYGLDRLREEQQ